MCAIKKAEIHLHLDGSMLPSTAYRLSKERGVVFTNCTTVEEFAAAMQMSDSKKSFHDFSKCFEIPKALLNNACALETVTLDLVDTLAEQGLEYAEIRWAPQLHVTPAFSQQDAVEAVLNALKKGKERHKTLCTNTILCALTSKTDYMNRYANIQTAELCVAYKNKGVVALDLAGGEWGESLDRYSELFRYARSQCVPFTIHAGETGDAGNVAQAVSWGATRIGHGCRAIEDQSVVKLLKDEGITLELCPTSNIQTGAQPSYARHSIRKLFDYGVKCTVNCDNLTACNTTPSNECMILKKYMGFTDEELEQLDQNAHDAAFRLV